MTSNPYTPNETELRDCYAGLSEEYAGEDYATAKADAERGIARIRAEAWDEGFRDGRRQDSEGDDGPKFVNPYRVGR